MSKGATESPNKAIHEAFVKRLWDADHLQMFHFPVDEKQVPGYTDVVKSPIDLTTIRNKIEKGQYKDDMELVDDVSLMLANALEFNHKSTKWYKEACDFKRKYLVWAKESGLTVDEDEAYIPVKQVKDDERTLIKEEEENAEDLDALVEQLEKDKEISLERLRELYSKHNREESYPTDSDDSSGSENDDDGMDKKRSRHAPEESSTEHMSSSSSNDDDDKNSSSNYDDSSYSYDSDSS